ncbi:MAG TPA: class E sortase [Acidimicrobiia bacterium]|nr:class E sortase [Acidimicrobiia bacterium]
MTVIDLTETTATPEPVAIVATAEPVPTATPAPVASKAVVRRVVRQALLIFATFVAGFALYLFVLSALPHARAQTGLERRFRSELANAVAPVNAPVALGAPVAVVEIPAIGLHEVVVEGSDARRLASGPGHVRGTALPGQAGTSIVLGRRTTFGAPFADLDRLEVGDELTVTAGQGETPYRVRSVERAAASDASVLVASNALLLVTSDPAVVADGRLVVTATPVGAPQAPGSRVAVELGLDELGLASDRSVVGELVLWMQVLVALALGTVVAFRRWRRGPAWVVAVPVLLAVLWVVYERAALLLPATL